MGGSTANLDAAMWKSVGTFTVYCDYIRVPSNAAMPAVIVYSGDSDQAPSPADLSEVFSDEVLQSSRVQLFSSAIQFQAQH